MCVQHVLHTLLFFHNKKIPGTLYDSGGFFYVCLTGFETATVGNKGIKCRVWGSLDLLNDRIGEHLIMQPGTYINLSGKQRHCNEKQFVGWGMIGTKIGILAFNSYDCVVLRFHMEHLHLSWSFFHNIITYMKWQALRVFVHGTDRVTFRRQRTKNRYAHQ